MKSPSSNCHDPKFIKGRESAGHCYQQLEWSSSSAEAAPQSTSPAFFSSRWMYNRNHPNRAGLRGEFIEVVAKFIAKAQSLDNFLIGGRIRCPCVKCKCVKSLKSDEIKVHLYKKGPIAEHNIENSRYNEMMRDAFGTFPGVQSEPNDEAKRFYEQLVEASRPLYEGSVHSKLSVAVRLLSIKSDSSISQAGMNSIIGLMNELNPSNIDLPKDFYTAKKLVSKLGLSSERIDYCEKGCMLFYKDDTSLENCKFCNQPRFKEIRNANTKKKVPVKAMHYLPLIPRLKRLYASMSSAPHMRWHYEHRRPPGILCHPSDGEAWKHFDMVFPEFASEPRNIRLGLCTDGFTPLLSLLHHIHVGQCPRNTKTLIDVYLQPLIDELQLLWHQGIETYDISTKQNFRLHAALMWTINNFPAYGMLFGWSTAGNLSCPCCMEDTKAFTLKHGGKNTWFDCHSRFLPMNHEFRRNTSAFMKNLTDFKEPLACLCSEEIWNRVRDLPKVIESPPSKIPGYGVAHNWTKRSIFWELPYWKHNLLRHNLDTKDNLKAMMDLKEYCRRSKLYLTYFNNKIQKPKASYTFTLDERREICSWVNNLRMPDGYASNLSSTLRVENLIYMESNIILTLNKLTKIFPLGFCDVMEHLPIHLAQEARLGGPVQCRWMYPFERTIGKCKRTIKNRSRIEGSICEAYVAKETSYFCSYYFEHDVPCLRNRPNRHDDGGKIDHLAPAFSIFNQPGKGGPKNSPKRRLSEMELKSATTHVLLNCPEVQPYYSYFVGTYGQDVVYPKFSEWFKEFITWGPDPRVRMMSKYLVNGYKFHTEEWSNGKKTKNSGVWVKGDRDVDYYGVLQEILELEYARVVLKTKPVGRVVVEDALDVAYQNEISNVESIADDELADELQHNEGIYEEFDSSVLATNEDEDRGVEHETINEEELLDESETGDDEDLDDYYEDSDED
ncbi:PREDICTED: uncharacterized protein LOC109220717 [Nicotiana attenuata]|uniref:uncharacterized protein LOC109220717 n=1 Tax=Nicotiana attenuata TaxID=49451 RepID=UPI0009048DA9|nr:PREDICTED: uncharacterized protein LOC109220717 [Nicotiana attenuata]